MKRRGEGLDSASSHLCSPVGGLFLRRGSCDGLQVGSAERHTPESGATWGEGGEVWGCSLSLSPEAELVSREQVGL